MRWLLLFMIISLIVVPASSQAQDDLPPYLMYYSRALDGWIIERADGTDSRIIGQGLVPENHRWIDGPGWSPSGAWFAWTSSDVNYYGWNFDSRGYVMHADGSSLREFDPGVTASNYSEGVILEWSPNADTLFVFLRYRPSDVSEEQHVSALLIDITTGDTLAMLDFVYVDQSYHNPTIIGWSPDGSAAAFYTLLFNEDTQRYEHWAFMLSPTGEVRRELIAPEPVGYIYSLGWSGQALVFYYELDEGDFLMRGRMMMLCALPCLPTGGAPTGKTQDWLA